MEKQLWKDIELHIREFYSNVLRQDDLNIAKAFFKSGWNVYPESGYMFQKTEEFNDGSKHEAHISIQEARELVRNLNHLSLGEKK